MADDKVLMARLNSAMAKAGVSPSRRARISLRRAAIPNDFGWNTYIKVQGKVPREVRERAARWVAKALEAEGHRFTAVVDAFGKEESGPKVVGCAVQIDAFCDMW